jgi:hypothetical protein
LCAFKIKGLNELQRKLEQFPNEVEKIRREVFRQYAEKIEHEAKEACPTTELRDSIKIEFQPNGNFSVNCSQEAKLYVDPVIQRNTKEMRDEIARRMTAMWQA